jgi:hypothetical protein
MSISTSETKQPIPRLIFNKMRSWWRASRAVSGVCVSDEFVQCTTKARTCFKISEGSAAFVCRRCQADASVVKCERKVTVHTIYGSDAGFATWLVPVCTSCDGEVPSRELTHPIIVVAGWRRDGWQRMGGRVAQFLQFKMNYSNPSK